MSLPMYDPRGGRHECVHGGHHLVADHNGDPVCCCGWDPSRRDAPPTVDRAMALVREHAQSYVAGAP